MLSTEARSLVVVLGVIGSSLYWFLFRDPSIFLHKQYAEFELVLPFEGRLLAQVDLDVHLNRRNFHYLVLRYQPCGSFPNEHYGTLLALNLGVVLGANTLILLPYEVNTGRQGVLAKSPASAFWDVGGIEKYLQDSGVKLYTPEFEGLAAPDSEALLDFNPERMDMDVKVEVALPVMEDLALLQAIPSWLLSNITEAVRAHGEGINSRVLLDVKCSQVLGQSSVPLLEMPSGPLWLGFAETLQSIVNKMLKTVDLVHKGFNAAQLWLGDGGHKWVDENGGTKWVSFMYSTGVRTANFTQRGLALYLASDSDLEALQKTDPSIKKLVRDLGESAPAVLYKEALLPPEDLDALSRQQKGAVDFAMLGYATNVVAPEYGGLFYLVQEYRLLKGHPPGTMMALRGMAATGERSSFDKGWDLTELTT